MDVNWCKISRECLERTVRRLLWMGIFKIVLNFKLTFVTDWLLCEKKGVGIGTDK